MAFWAAFFKGRRRAHQRQYESGKTGWVRRPRPNRQRKKPQRPNALFGEGQPTKAARQAAPGPSGEAADVEAGQAKTIPSRTQ